MKVSVMLTLGTILTLLAMGSAEQLFLGTDYSSQQGTKTSGTTVTHFDENDYMVYSSVNFGSSGSVRGFLLNYSKGNDNGELEIRKGSGVNGQLIAKISPARTNGWNEFCTAYVGLISDMTGVHEITFVAKKGNGLLNLAWFELSDFSARTDAEYPRILATEIANQSGIRLENQGNVGYFDTNDFVTYSKVNFGEAGTTDSIRFRYAKNNEGGKMEIRSGGPTGTLLGTFSPTSTVGWQMYRDTYIGLDNISGIHDITFVGKEGHGVLNFMWFEPAKRSADLYPHVLATGFSDQSGLKSTYDKITHFDKGDYATYTSLNFGPAATTRSIRMSYAKGNTSKGKIEIRLDGPEGKIIATYFPKYTGGWDEFVTVDVLIDSVQGVHDLTFLGRDHDGVWDPEWFELSGKLLFNLDTDYEVNDVDIQCTYATVKNAYIEQVYNRYFSNSGVAAENQFISHLGVANVDAAKKYVKDNLCGAAQAALDEIPLSDITYDQGSQFIELFYSGRGSWNEETETKLYPGSNSEPANVLKQDAYKVKEYKAKSEQSVFKMPEDLPQFDPNVCVSHAAQCCWPRDRQANDNNGNCATPYDENCIDKDVADNTDLCYNNLDKAPYANGIDANGFSTYDHEGPIHCHGFAWSTDDQEISSRYKANALFFVSMYDHMYQRGYVENIPGSPMCGCVEHMPTVTRSDCTQTNVKEYYTFYENTNGSGFSSVISGIKLEYQACQGANNNNNDLGAFVQQLVNDGKLSSTEQDMFQNYVVGKNNCPSAVEKLWEESGFERGHDIDYDEWTFVVGEGFDSETPIYDKRLFKEMFEAQDVQIVRRVCPSCKTSHKDIYYRRLTKMPEDFDLLDTLMNNWFSANNKLNEDFSLHSTYLDAFYGVRGWNSCNYDDPGIGFPRDCGPHGRVDFQWNSYTRNGGDANHHAFLIPADPDFVSTYVPRLHPTLKGTDYSYQKGTSTSGTTVTHFDNNDYLIYTSINFGSVGSTRGILLNYSKGNEHGELEVRLGAGTSGTLIARISPSSTNSWNSFNTAHVGFLTDVSGVHDITFVGKKSSGVLNVGSFELSDFAYRTSTTHARVPASEYSNQSGVRFENQGNLGYFDKDDYVTYSNLNFGSSGTTNAILLHYAKGNDGGEVEIRLGSGVNGQLIGKMRPAKTFDWQRYITAHVELLTEVTGIQDITFVGKGSHGVFNLLWFELSDLSDRSDAIHARIPVTEYSNQSGIVFETHGNIGYWDKDDYVTYANVNFGTAGTTNNIKFNYAKASNGGALEIRSGGPTGTLLATFNPSNTGGWQTYREEDVPISASGIMDITFVGKDVGGVLNLKWFELRP